MSAASCTYEVIEDTRAWAALEPEWRELFAAAENPSSTLRWEWLNEWWSVFGPRYGAAPGGLKILTLRNESRLIAALPLYLQRSGAISRSRLGFIGTGENASEAVYPEKLDVLHRQLTAPQRHEASKSLAEALAKIAWDEWDLGVGSENSLLAEVAGALPSGAKRVHKTFPDPIADLSGGFEAYVERQSSNTRQQFRRMLRAVPKAGLTFEVAEHEAQALHFLEELITLHQKRWHDSGQSGAFHSTAVREFHRRVLSKLLARGEVVIARLGNANEAVAVLYGFVASDCFDFYQSGLIREGYGELKSPGIAAHLLLMQFLAGRGITTYDFLAGASSYKDKLATANRALVRVRLLKLTLGNMMYIVQELGTRISKRFARAPRVSDPEAKHA